ncbi:MAG TPA: radical SAM protein [Candidatus Tectomicrobia bacterium]|nr:radical SAM protein [Candidatus Tectomicrobia bacterium]
MRVLLIYPKARQELIGWGDLGAIAEPLALEYLAAGAMSDSHEVRVLDLRLHPSELDQTVREFVPEVVGVTGYSMHVLRNLTICRRLKQLLPSCWTVVGGHHATLMPEDFFEPEVDFVVCGEGVRPFRALLQAIDTNLPARGIPGVWSRVDGTFISGGDQPLFDIDDIPAPERSVSLGDRDAYFIDWMKPIALLRTTVGCPYRCSFCSLWKIMDGKYYDRDIARVVDELAAIREECVFLVDDEPFVNGRRMRQLASAIKAVGIQKRYFAYCRIDSFLRQRELMVAWREIGLERLFFGIEAISAKDLTDYNKRLNLAQIEAGLASARELGIEIFAQFIVNTDYTRREFTQLVRFIKHHKISYPAFTILTPLPGTEALRTFAHISERQPNGRPNWELFDLQHPVIKTTMAREEFMKEYQGLRQVFLGSYTPYRGYDLNIPSDPGDRAALLEG